MAGSAASIPVEQIHQFWTGVEECLRGAHGLTGDAPLRAILRYRDEVERVGPLVYHNDVAEVAQDIVAGGYAEMLRAVV